MSSSSALRREVQAIALLLLALFLAGALTVQAVANVRGAEAVQGSFGTLGSMLAAPLVTAFGWIAAVLVPLAAGVHALRLFGRLESRSDRSWMIFLLGMVLLLPISVGLIQGGAIPDQTTPLAGLWGDWVSYYVVRVAGGVGAWILLALTLSTLTAATLSWNPVRILVGTRRRTLLADGATNDSAAASRATRAEVLAPAPEELEALNPALLGNPDRELAEDDRHAATTAAPASRGRKSRSELAAQHEGRIRAEMDAEEPAVDFTDEDLPSPSLLTPAPPRNAELGRRELDAAGVKLMEALRTFRVEGELVGRTTGPAVTQFEIAPAAGVKVRQIATLADDLALAMRAQSIRIVAPIPGKGAVGVEVPNPTPEMVAFREIIETRDYQTARAALPIALGRDLEGRPVVADLAKMPHLLIAGATGSGKSVCVNTIITSLLYRHTPRTLRFLMVDPKMVELSVYNTIPHLRHKVVTDNRDAAAVLKWAVMEMSQRYSLLAENGARNIEDFNRKVREGTPLRLPKRPDVAFENREYSAGVLPYIVLIIDELADLMMTVQGEVEAPLAMLAQKARAIGIHLILATQRPSVNVITGLIKANFPSRIAFRVASQIDSRTIIDGMGAESLLGNGDMLFLPPGKSELSRIQGAYLSSEDTESLMGWYRERAELRRGTSEGEGAAPASSASEEDILEAVRRKEAEDGATHDSDGAASESARDPVFREAAEAVIMNRRGSTSLLQRKLNLGYGRAARIIDQLQQAGVLGESQGARGCEVLVTLEDLDRKCGPV